MPCLRMEASRRASLLQNFLRGGAWTWIAPHPDGRMSVMGLHAKTRFGFYTVSRDGRQVVSSKLATNLPLQWTNEGTRVATVSMERDRHGHLSRGDFERSAERLESACRSGNPRVADC